MADCPLDLIQRYQAEIEYLWLGEETRLSLTSTSTMLTTFDHPKHSTRHRRWLVLVGFVPILLGPVPMTSAANPVSDPANLPLSISGETDKQGIPVGWDLEAFHNHPDIKIEPLKDGQFGVRLTSKESSFGLYKVIEVDLNEFPILSWRWKVDHLPPAGDIRKKSKNDQAAQLYVIFPNSFIRLRSPTIGYLWDSNAPEGTTTNGHAPITPIKVIVLRSGKQQLGEWVQERRNVAEDYVRLFGQGPLPKVGRVAIWINTQHTKSTAQATFADLRFLRAQ